MKRTLFLVLGLGVVLWAGKAMALEPLPKSAKKPSDTPEKIELGKMLFFDPRLSADGTISCNSCHNIMAGGDDDRPVSAGVRGQRGGRSAPTVFNAAFHSTQFWDGRAKNLEEQAKGPLVNPVEMGNPNIDAVVARLKEIPGYVSSFEKAFGKNDSLTSDHLAEAIAAFERTLITPKSPLDRYLRGNKKALSPAQIRGMEKFSQIGCVSCHSGPNFDGQAGLAEGQGFFQKFPTFTSDFEKKYRLTEDEGRYEVTKNDQDRHFFRVPTLRNVALTAPYFHNGAVPTLEEAVRVMAKTQLNRDLEDKDVSDLTAFLQALTDTPQPQLWPKLPEAPGKSVVAPDTLSP